MTSNLYLEEAIEIEIDQAKTSPSKHQPQREQPQDLCHDVSITMTQTMTRSTSIAEPSRAKDQKRSKTQCNCLRSSSPLPSDPSTWPQRPIMLRPTPGSSTKILGIRRAGESLKRIKSSDDFPCLNCALPINNGTETSGNSLVIDFESNLFVGSFLLRIKQAPKHSNSNVADTTTENNDSSYFDGRKRKFQAVVRGRFKRALPMNDCVTGQVFERPAGKLPSVFLVGAFLKFFRTLAPQLQADISAPKPYFLSPLVSTAQTVLQHDDDDSKCHESSTELERDIQEPHYDEDTSILQAVRDQLGKKIPDSSKTSVERRMKYRKKLFNELTLKHHHDERLRFDTDKEYTFEFYQHLLDFSSELAIDSPFGRMGLTKATDGQPLKFQSAYRSNSFSSGSDIVDQLDSLWDFEIWHESLFPRAKERYLREKNKST